jgi:hypothetical protein
MEHRLKYFFMLLFLSFFLPLHTNEFVKSKKVLQPKKIKPEDCCMQALPLLQEAGKLLQELGTMQETMAQVVGDGIEQDKKSFLANATQKQLQEFQKRQELIYESIGELREELTAFNAYLKKPC